MSRRPPPTILLIALLIAALACARGAGAGAPPEATPAGLAPGEHRRSLSVGGLERSFLIHVPPTHDPALPTPVVLIFHGGGGRAEGMDGISGFNAQSDTSGFIAVYPNGTGRLEDRLLTWNGGLCCGYAQEQNVDDVGFVRALLDDLATLVNVDPNRVYATGLSNGAIMAYRLACDLSDQIAAIGPVAASQNVESCEPTRPVPVIHFHGDADPYAPYAGGVGEGLSGFSFSPVIETIAFWVERNGCPTEPKVEQIGAAVTLETYGPCDQESAVELYTIEGGGHAWPGGEKYGPNAAEPTQEISATTTMWEFFAAHPMPSDAGKALRSTNKYFSYSLQQLP